MNKYVSEETKKWEKRVEIIDALQPAIWILSIGAIIVTLINL